MIITRKYAMSLIKAGKARIESATIDEFGEPEYVIVVRYDVQRDDHYRYTLADAVAVASSEAYLLKQA